MSAKRKSKTPPARHVFVTGFPGFIAARLVELAAKAHPDLSFTLLVLRNFELPAQRLLAELGLTKRARLVVGDITQPRLGMTQRSWDAATAKTTHLWHLAAIYDLAVGEPLAQRVNVVGTANVLDLAEACAGLHRLDYISTCYVSGDRLGVVTEDELDENQGFKNHYEATKFRAEVEVRRRMPRLPVAIHRPAIVIGDSVTGATAKFDGPYFFIRLILRLPPWLSRINAVAGSAPMNLVPIDFLVSAMAALMFDEAAIGQTIQLADPRPHTSKEIAEAVLRTLDRPAPLLSLPPRLVAAAMKLGPIQAFSGAPAEGGPFLYHSADYDTTNQRRLLDPAGIACPDLLDYLPTLVRWVQRHPQP